jgi:hypothetical protein
MDLALKGACPLRPTELPVTPQRALASIRAIAGRCFFDTFSAALSHPCAQGRQNYLETGMLRLAPSAHLVGSRRRLGPPPIPVRLRLGRPAFCCRIAWGTNAPLFSGSYNDRRMHGRGHAAQRGRGRARHCVAERRCQGRLCLWLGYKFATSAEAQAKALERCRETKSEERRKLCKIVNIIHDQCVAVAMDPADGTPGVGRAVADNLLGAERIALEKCEATTGPGFACKVHSSVCDGAPK